MLHLELMCGMSIIPKFARLEDGIKEFTIEEAEEDLADN